MRAPQRIIVLGAGAIGAAIGALLFETGSPCVLVARGAHGQAMREHGVRLRFPASARCIRVPTVASVADAQPTPNDLVLLATMGQHTEMALGSLSSEMTVASFQNGTTPLEQIADRGHRTLAAMVYIPAERRKPGIIALPGVPHVGSVLLGAWHRGDNEWADWLVERLRTGGMHAEHETTIAPWIRAKLLANLGGIVSALCDQPADDITEAAQDEARAVWRASNEPFEEVSALLQRIGPLRTELVDGRARNGGSTRQSLARGEALETPSLHGAIVRAGLRACVPTPVNAALIELADQATREQWRPGCCSLPELRARVGVCPMS